MPMRELVEIFEKLGCREVKTYIQSGNVVFVDSGREKTSIGGILAAEILERYGFEPAVMVLDEAQLQQAIDGNPFPTETGKFLHFFFLDSEPAEPDLTALATVKTETEEYRLDGTVFYLYAPDGVARSKLFKRIEPCLGVPVTARNWNTVSKLAELVRE